MTGGIERGSAAAATALLVLCAAGSWQVPSWNMVLSERGAVTELIDSTWCGHVQGMCVTSNAFFFAYHDQIVKTDWQGRFLVRREVPIHTGDICAWNGRLYTAVSKSSSDGNGRIQVFDEDLNLIRDTPIRRGSDGITCLNGVIYIGLGSGGTTAQPYRGNWYGKYDAETLEPLCEPFRIDHGYDTTSGVQNMATDGTYIYVNFYCPDETADTPCFIVFDRDMNVLDAHLFGWRQGLDVVPGGENGAVRFAYCTTANWMSSSERPVLPVQAVVRFAELKDGAIRTIDDSSMAEAIREIVEPDAPPEIVVEAKLGGTVNVACNESGAISNLVAMPVGGETISISGDEMTFADGAVISLASTGTLVFAGNVQAAGALTLERGDGAHVVWRGDPLEETHVGHPLAFPGLVRDDVDFVSVIACNTAPGRFSFVSEAGSGFYVFNRLAAGHVYSARIQLTEESDGLHARCRTGVRSPRFGLYPDDEDGWLAENLWLKWGKAYSSIFGTFGYRDDPATYGGTWIGSTSAFGFRKLVVRRKGMTGSARIRFDGGVTFGGETSVGAGVEAVIAVADGDGAAMLSNSFTGDGDIVIVPQADAAAYGGMFHMEDFIAKNQWKVLAVNQSLATMERIVGCMQGKNHNPNGPVSSCDTFYYRYDAATDTATCQFQFKRYEVVDGTYQPGGVKYVKAKLRQNGNNVEIMATGAGFYRDGVYGADFTDSADNNSVSTRINPALGYVGENLSAGYGIRQITATFSGERRHAFATLSGCMSNMVGSAISFVGGESPLSVSVTSNVALTAYGEVNVGTNATVLYEAPGLVVGNGISGGGSTITVGRGGMLRRKRDGQIGSTQRVVLDGGVLSNEGGAYYLNDLTMRNGARIRPFAKVPQRVAANGTRQLIRVEGTEAVSIDEGIRVYGVTNATISLRNDYACRIEVTDAAGVLNLGKIYLDDQRRPQYFVFPLEKYGAGSLNLIDDCTNVRMATRVFGGTVRLCASGIATNDMLLAGGNLAAAGGVTNALGVLSVEEVGGTLTLDDGSAFTFADSHGATWAGDVTVKGFRGRAIRFGSSRTGLTEEQCSRMRTDRGHRLTLDDDGFLIMRGLSISLE
ncbi:MAG: hypothetical protein IJH50_14125 [Kiritimatiellae bacterium]|nr:hypothetical protein [Kiritimatiellia bacterium]